MADYGLLVTNELAKETQQLKKTEDIASAVQLPLTTVRKILQHLVDAKVVESFRGINGGYRLAKPAEDLKIVDVISAIEGPIAITECSVGNTCNLQQHCRLRENWSYINFLVERVLRQISLADMSKTLLMKENEVDIVELLNRFSKAETHIPY